MPDVELRPTTRARWLWSLGALCFALAVMAFVIWRIEVQTAAELAETEARLAALTLRERLITELMNNRNIGAVILDSSGVIRDWNRAMEVLTGYKAPEMIGSDLSRIMSPEQWESHRTAYDLEQVRPEEFRLIPCDVIPKEGNPVSVVIRVQQAELGEPYNAVFALGLVSRSEDVKVEGQQ